MRWLIRRVFRKGKGQISYEEEIHEGDVLTVGRATDCIVQLPDLRAALDHAGITALGSGRYRVESRILAGIRIDGQITQAATVGAGARVEIGASRLTLLAPPRGYDAAIEVGALDRTEQAAAKARQALPTTLAETRLGKRGPSWILFLLILAVGFAIPAASHYAPGLRAFLAHAHLPGTGFWNPGPLDSAHRYFGDDCTSCHQHAFLTVRNDACLACHATTKAHADPAKFHLAALGDSDCRSCHQDHNGPNGMIRTDQRLCADCHGDLAAKTAGASTLPDISDFGTAHPEFRLNLPAWTASGKFMPVATTWSKGLAEHSGLKFNHAKHLDPKGLNTPDGPRTLACADCHRPEPGGAKMQPIQFEGMCHQCHTLGFDTLAPDREVPHADVAGVIYALDEYYAKRALEGGYDDAAAPPGVRQRRRPGQPPASQQEKQAALAWARQRSGQAARTVFTGKACITCHTVTEPSPEGNGKDWKIAPVRVSGQWYVDAKFTHARHATMACEDCHAGAAKSDTASDLLIPGIATCRDCHGGTHSARKVQSTCIDCHDFHRSDQLMSKAFQ
jgi:predicted CXXCH cytochrome family protein